MNSITIQELEECHLIMDRPGFRTDSLNGPYSKDVFGVGSGFPILGPGGGGEEQLPDDLNPLYPVSRK